MAAGMQKNAYIHEAMTQKRGSMLSESMEPSYTRGSLVLLDTRV